MVNPANAHGTLFGIAADGAAKQEFAAKNNLLDFLKDDIRKAEANLAVIDAQLAKLVITAPSDGIILNRNIQPGEMATPGAVAFSMARLDDLTLTVFIPEDRYGEILLGQQVDVQVDSFPGETFGAEVIHIADQAEFTPHNVQTADGRKSTVFAIKLRLTNPEGKLKPGMPADVTFK